MANIDLSKAKNAKSDEFYTQLADIEKEADAYLEHDPDVFRGKTVFCPCDDPSESNFFKYFAARFQPLGLRKLIAAGYAGSPAGTPRKIEITGIPNVDLAGDTNHCARLRGDGDFRSEEITKLRDEADMIITNPPFSLFREFLAWIMAAKKKFLIIGNINAITYKEVFPLIKENTMWLGASIHSGDREFAVPDTYPLYAAGFRIDENGKKYIRIKGVRWFTNLDHGRRHQPIRLMTMADNLKSSRHTKVRGKKEYARYDNYAAIEVPFTDAIPSDYDGAMGVPISFLDKYCPEQFAIVNANDIRTNADVPYKEHGLIKDKEGAINGKPTYVRIVIKKMGSK